MALSFFDQPILNSPYVCPLQHWELDESGQPTQQIIPRRRPAEFITPIPRPKKRRGREADSQLSLDLKEDKGLSTAEQQYDVTSMINELRRHLDLWRSLSSSNHWNVTPETARLLQHWRNYPFNSVRPFFCQVEAVETVIWLTEVAPNDKAGKRFIEWLENANNDANPELIRIVYR